MAPGVLLAALVGFGSVPAPAGDLETAQRLFHDGDFLAAAEKAAPLGTAESYAVAIRSLLVHGRYRAEEGQRLATYERAIQLFEAALEIYPEDPELFVLAAAILGRYGKEIGPREALKQHLFRRGREMLEKAVALAPDLGTAVGGLGSWHGRLLGEGGFFARTLTRADSDTGRELLERAEPLAGEDVALLFAMARGWSGLGENERARRLLARAIASPASDAYSELVRDRARYLDSKLADR